jgi:hypothetical protein
MPHAAPRIDSRLVAGIARLDDPRRPIAETHRRVGALAERVGLPRPSYEQVRVLVHLLRAARRDPGPGDVLLEIAMRARPPSAIFEALEALE